jgi:hypothetical protein
MFDDYLILGNREQQNLDGSRVEGHQADLREYLRQTFPLAYVTSHRPISTSAKTHAPI